MLKRDALWLLVGLTLLGGFAALWLAQRESDIEAIPVACQDISQGCMSAAHRLRIQFSHPPQVMQPFSLKVEALEATQVYASFAMAGMEMGFNRYRLVQSALGTWTSLVTLPVCVQGRSDWTMLLEVNTPSGERRYLLKFKAI